MLCSGGVCFHMEVRAIKTWKRSDKETSDNGTVEEGAPELDVAVADVTRLRAPTFSTVATSLQGCRARYSSHSLRH